MTGVARGILEILEKNCECWGFPSKMSAGWPAIANLYICEELFYIDSWTFVVDRIRDLVIVLDIVEPLYLIG